MSQTNKNSSIWKASAIMLFGSFAVNIGNYIFAIVTARILGPESYGVLATIFSILAITTILGTAGNLLAMRSVAHAAPDKWQEAMGVRVKFRRTAFLIVLTPSLGLILVSPFLIHAFAISMVQILSLVVLTAITMWLTIERGFIQGMQQYARVSISLITEVLGKLIGIVIIGIVLTKTNATTTVDVLLVISVYALSALLAWSKLWKHQWLLAQDASYKSSATMPSWRYVGGTIISLASLAILLNSDILAAKGALSSRDAGQMAALAKMGQVIFFSTAPVISAVFPLISSSFDNGTKHVHLLLRAVFLSTVLASGILLLFIVFPNATVKILFGSEYSQTTGLLTKMGLAMVAFTVGNLYINYYLSIKELRFLNIAACIAVLHILLLSRYNQSLEQITTIDAITFSLLAVTAVLWYVIQKRNRLPHLLAIDQHTWQLLLHGTEK